MDFFYQVISEVIRRFTILLIFVFFLVFFFMGAGDIRPQGSVFVPNADVSRILEGWNLYRNYEIGFEIMHPRSTMISVRKEGEADEVRFDFPMIYPGIF